MLDLPFHHIGVATRSIALEMPIFAALGFGFEAEFRDEAQGVRGVFVVKNAPFCRLELLENLPNSTRLDGYLKTHHKLYHIALQSENLAQDVERILGADFGLDSPDAAGVSAGLNGDSVGGFAGLFSCFDGGGGAASNPPKIPNSTGGGGTMNPKTPTNRAQSPSQGTPRARILIPIMEASYFARLCFVMLPNRLLLELVELKTPTESKNGGQE